MARTIRITDITTQSEGWRVKVLIAEKSNIYTNDRGTRVQKMLLLDDQGGQVEGVLWNHNINLYEGNLHPFGTYIIGDAQVQQLKPGNQYARAGITFQWVISRPTFVHPVTEEPEKLPYPLVEQTHFADIRSIADTGSLVDLVAVVTDVKDIKYRAVKGGQLKPIRECTIIQQELTPIMLTLWGDLVEQQGAELFGLRNDAPIILCKGLKSTSFTGVVSLSMLPFSFLSLEPDIPEATQLRQWADENLDTINKAGEEPAKTYLESTQHNTESIRTSPLSAVTPNSQALHCAVSATIADTHQKLGYTVCPKCQQTQKAMYKETFKCSTCRENHVAESRCKVVLQLTDATRTLDATLFDKCAEKMLGISTTEVHEMDKQTLRKRLQELNKRLDGKQLIVEIKAPQKQYNDKILRYTVESWIEDQSTEVLDASNKDAQTEPAKQTRTPRGQKEACAKEDGTSEDNGHTRGREHASESNEEPAKRLKTATKNTEA